MRQSQLVTNISRYLYGSKEGHEYSISEILGFCKGRDDDFTNKILINKKFKTLTEFLDAVKSVYRQFNPKNYDTENIVVWIYIEQISLRSIFLGFSRELTDIEWQNVRTTLKIDTVDIKDGQFAILNF